MRVAAFDFDLPRNLIAERPSEPRDAARLLEVSETLGDRHFRDLPGLLKAGDVVVFNDTRVIPVRLTGRRGQAKVEVTLHRDLGDGRWLAFARPARKLRPGDELRFGEDFAARMEGRGEGGEVTLAFDRAGAALAAALDEHGVMPLPPYIPRAAGADTRDRADYQTVYATRPGAVAAPTAGLHFTPELLDALDRAGIARVHLTLHVGAGTFLPVKVDDTDDHRMHAEHGQITDVAAESVNAARAAGGRVVAVGSTALRLLESAADETGQVRPFDGATDIFMTPGYRFRAVDLMLTNFHLPRSTLFMLVAAFSGLDRMKAAYAHAVASDYRFYSYGDACLLHPANGA